MTQYIAADQLTPGDRVAIHGDEPVVVLTAPDHDVEPGFVYVRSTRPVPGRLIAFSLFQHRLGTHEQVTLVRRHCDQRCGRPADVYGGGRGAGDWAGYYCNLCLEALGFIVFDELS